MFFFAEIPDTYLTSQVWLRMELNAIQGADRLFPSESSEDFYMGPREGFNPLMSSGGALLGTTPVVFTQKEAFAECTALREAREVAEAGAGAGADGAPLFVFLDTSAVITMLGRVGVLERLRGLAELKGGDRIFLVILDVVRCELDGVKDRFVRWAEGVMSYNTSSTSSLRSRVTRVTCAAWARQEFQVA
jgi:hypothetical protein